MGCGVCDMCVSGNTHLCPEYKAFGINMDGGFAEYVVVPEIAVRQGNLVKIAIDENMSFAKAAAVEPLSCVYNGFEKLNIRPNDTVLLLAPALSELCTLCWQKWPAPPKLLSMI